MQLIIKTVQPPVGGDAEFPVDIDTSVTVAELKEQITDRVGLPKDHIRLVCAGRIWADAATVGSFEPRDGSIVHCLNNPPRGAPAGAQQTLTPANPMAQMMGGGMAPAPAAGGDPMQNMMAQAQQQVMQNPEMVQQMMRSPMVQQMMSNPDTMRAMMRMNPQLNELMETRPEIARMLEDPEVLRQSMQMMSNPALMREMTRNADRAIGQLDVMPGGHNALVRAHQDFADPLYEAMSGSNGAAIAANAEAYAQQTQGAPNNAPLTNPWGAPAAAPAPAAAVPAAAAPAPAAANPFAPTMGAPAQNPMLQMMQQPQQPQQPQQTGGAQQGAAANPMAAMMQQMMSNPQQMQQMMGLSQQMMGGGGFGGPGLGAPFGASAAQAAPGADAGVGAAPAQQGAAANPMAAMMQQMMSNPQQMQQMMGLSQQLMGGGGFGGGGGGFGGGFGDMQQAGGEQAPMNPFMLDAQRQRFAEQMTQLMAMGFTNEDVCLRVLVQHNGRVDAAIDTLLASGEGQS